MPTFRTGKICYLIIPAKKVEESASFYERSFGWNIRERSTGSPSFDDTTGDVSGTWTTDREPDPDPGIQIYIMVADVRSAAERVEAAGGSIVLPAGEYGGEHLAHFCDPAGNLMGIYQQPGLADQEAASGKGGVPTRHEV